MNSFPVLLAIATSALAQTPDATEIVRRTAENISRAQPARTAWLYDQDIFVRLQRSGGKLAREENREYTVAPTEKGSGRKLDKVEGRVVEGKKEIDYSAAGFRRNDKDIDGAILDGIAREILWRRDNIGLLEYRNPLDPANLDKFVFRLLGQERYHDYDVYRIAFDAMQDEWEGEALIDRNEFQPVLITSAWAGKVPAAVRFALGTNVRHVGEKIAYQRFEKDVWFPVQCGGEMDLRVLFLYKRTIAFRATNRGFRKTDVQSSIEYNDQLDSAQAGGSVVSETK